MIRRETDATLINAIANDPSVRPTLGYHEGPTDLSPIFAHPDKVIALSNGKDAAALFEWTAPGVWASHSMVLPSCRGKEAVEAGKAMLAWMFDHGARLIWGQTPLENRAARMFNRLIGARPEGTGRDAAGVEIEYFVVEKP